MTKQNLKTEIESCINNTLEIISLREKQITNLKMFVNNEKMRLEHFKQQIKDLGYEESV